MKKILFAAIIVWLAPPATFGQPIGTPAELALGDVATGPTLATEFAFKLPAGDKPVFLGEPVLPCGCTKAALSAKELQPGGTATLTVQLNTIAQAAGKHRWTIRVPYTQGTAAGAIELGMTANLIQEVSLQPASLAMSLTGAAKHTWTLTDVRAKPLAIVECATGHEHLSVTIGAAKAGKQEFTLHVADGLKPGRLNTLLVLTTDDEACRTLRVPVLLEKRSSTDVVATPEEADIITSAGKHTASTLVQLRHHGKSFRIASVESFTPGVTVKSPTEADTVLTLRVIADTATAGATGVGSLSVTFADEKLPKLLIPVKWGGR